MPERARVFVAEDNLDFLDTLRLILNQAGHTVVSDATSLEHALKAVREFRQLGIQVASIDGNLKLGVTSGADGHQLVNAIRIAAPNVKIIGMSGETFPGVDVDLGKDRFEELGKIVSAL